MHIWYIPPGYTDELYPLDVLFNAVIQQKEKNVCEKNEKFGLRMLLWNQNMTKGKDPKDLDQQIN